MRFNFYKNVCADALSRLHAPEEVPSVPDPILPQKIFVCPIQPLDQELTISNASNLPLTGCPPGHTYVP